MKTIFTNVTLLIAAFSLGCSTMGESGGVYRSSAETVSTNPMASELPENLAYDVSENQSQAKADYHFTLAESYSLQGNSPQAVENYKTALVHDQSSAHMRYRLALEYVKLGLVSEALSEAQKAQSYNENHRDLGLLLGGLYSALSLYSEALSQYQNILSQNPNDLEASLFVGALYAEEGNFDKSVDHFLKMSRNNDIQDKTQVWYYLGRVYSSMDPPQVANAESSFATAVKLKSDDVDSITALGTLYEVQGRVEKAKRLYADYQSAYGNSPSIAERLGPLYLADSQLEEAYEQLAIVEKHNPQDLNTKLKVALLLIEKKQYESAIQRLRSLATQRPDSAKIRFYLGALYEEIQNYPSAIQEFQTINFGSEFFEDSVMHSAYLYKLLGNYSGAVGEVKRGLAHEPDNPRYWILHGTLLDEGGHLKAAVEVLAKAYKKFPENTQVNFQLSSVYDRAGQKEKTVLHLEKVLEFDENHIQALNYLAYVYAENTNNLSAAEKLAKRALGLQPGDGFIMDTLGWVYYKQGRVSEAISILETAFAKEQDESIIAEHLADAYERNQLHRKAMVFYQKAIQLQQDSGEKQKLSRKLATIEGQISSDQWLRQERQPASK